MEEFSTKAVKDLRVRLGLTQEEFAHRLGVTFSTINRWENDRCIPSRLARKALMNLAAESLASA